VGEISDKVAGLSDTQFLAEFRHALVALYPILLRLDCLEDDTQPYDDFEAVAEGLWGVLVLRSLAWKYGLDRPPDLGRYGFEESGPDGFIEVRSPELAAAGRFVEFVGCRAFGAEPFNAVAAVNTGGRVLLPWEKRLTARWVRPTTKQTPSTNQGRDCR
jgi:hypothetical protein